MASHFRLPLLLLISCSFLIQTCQSTTQNIQVYFPIPVTPPPSVAITTSSSSSSGSKTVAKAVAVTAATSLVLSGLFLLLFLKFKRGSKLQPTNLNAADTVVNHSQAVLQKNDAFVRVGGIQGVIVNEQGLDVFYWRRLEQQNNAAASIPLKEISMSQFVLDSPPVKEIPLHDIIATQTLSDHAPPLQVSVASTSTPSPILVVEMKGNTPPPSPPPPPPRVPIVVAEMKGNAPSPPPPTVVVKKTGNAPPPPPCVPIVVAEMKGNAPPPPPPPRPPTVVVKKTPPPPLQPKYDGLTSSSRQTPDDNEVRFKPLHWDKVNANVEHSMVWHKLYNGSFRVDDNLMESLFGTIPIHTKTQKQEPTPKAHMKSQVFLLDTRKSQNIAIVVKSLPISRTKMIHCLQQGKGLDIDTLEKLSRITPSAQDIKLILEFQGDTANLADAESFLYHVTKSVPAAFTRVRIMLFKSNFGPQVSDVRKSLQILEMACQELKTRGLFVKLLEAVLKAGNRMNVGTSRGDAQAFNLNSLLKLSDVKSSDGNTTLLHFVVEQVVRSEGKRCNIKRSHSSTTSTGGLSTSEFAENYYIKLGLPVVGGVSSEFSNVKKAAEIDYDALSKSCSGLSDHLSEITETIEECDRDRNGGCFVREMLTFLKGAKREIQLLREEEGRIMGLVKTTNEYFQAGTSKDIGRKQFQLFVIIRGFLNMVDKACLDIAIKLQKRATRVGSPEAAIQMSRSPARPPMKFLVLPVNFRSTESSSSSSSSSSSDSD